MIEDDRGLSGPGRPAVRAWKWKNPARAELGDDPGERDVVPDVHGREDRPGRREDVKAIGDADVCAGLALDPEAGRGLQGQGTVRGERCLWLHAVTRP